MAMIVSFEGLPNSGKSTASWMLKEKLCQAGIKTVVFDADNFGDGVTIRNIANKYRPGHFSRVLLYWILHFQQEDAIERFQDDVDVIIVDRFWGSVSAIDGSSDIPKDLLQIVLSYSTKPDLTFFLDVPLKIALGRKERKSILINDSQLAKKIDKRYKKLADRENWVKVDAMAEKNIICDKCFSQLIKKLHKMRDLERIPYYLTSMI